MTIVADLKRDIEAMQAALAGIRSRLDVLEREVGDGMVAGGGPVLDDRAFAVMHVGRVCVLGPGPAFEILHRLLRRPGWYVAINDLQREAWPDWPVERSTVRAEVSRLRAKLKKAGLVQVADSITAQGGQYAAIPLWADTSAAKNAAPMQRRCSAAV